MLFAKSMVNRCLENYENNKNKILGIRNFYTAFSISVWCLKGMDVLKSVNTSIFKKRNKLYREFYISTFKGGDKKVFNRLIEQIEQDQQVIYNFLDKAQDFTDDYSQDEMINWERRKGAVAVEVF